MRTIIESTPIPTGTITKTGHMTYQIDSEGKRRPVATSQSYKATRKQRMMAAMQAQRLDALDHAQRREEIRAQRIEPLPANQIGMVA